ncbi:MAG TPA: DUF4157 domain-containing protein [Blastocatellia bacterium]|nr:DUF4157 domain-containing protein [Blastocatellia bacterium]
MGNEQSQAPQKANHEPASAIKSAAQEKTHSPASSYLPAPGLSMSGASSADDIPLTRDNILYLQRTIGNRAVVQLLQRKAKISQPGDAYEREADRVADQVMRMPQQANEDEKRKRPEEETAVQMKSVDGAADIHRQEMSQEEEKRKRPEEETTVQAKEGAGEAPEVTPEVESGITNLQSGGEPLSENVRAEFEPRFGQDFSEVRVHKGGQAEESARSLNARAYTTGRDIAFGAGEYKPETDEGKKLIAHELTHVVQQGGADHSLGRAPTSVQRWRWPWEEVPNNDAERIRLGVAGDTDAIVEITNFSSATETQRLTMVDHLTHQFWVGSGSEAALAGIWNSFGADFSRVAGENSLRWRNSVARYSGLFDVVPEAQRIRAAFVGDVKALALQNLSTNRTYAEGEMQRLGIPRNASDQAAPPTEAQADELARLQVAAEGLAKLQRAQEAAREAFVGYQQTQGQSESAYRRVHFDPESPPPLTELPGGSFDLWDDSRERWVSFRFGLPNPEGTYFGEAEAYLASLELSRRLTALTAYAPLKVRYDEATAAIAAHLAAFPQLYAITVQGNSAVSGRLANARTPEEARAVLGEAFRTLLGNIVRTEQALNDGGLNPLDLTPLHDRMFASPEPAPSGVIWSVAFPRTVGEMLARDHHIEVALRQLLLQTVTQLAFVFAPIAGPLAIPLLLVGVGAAGANYALDSSRYSALAAAAGSGAQPGTQLVTRTAVDEARMAMEADMIALALAALVLGAAVASRVIGAMARPRWQGPRIRSGIGQRGFREPESIPQIKADMQNGTFRFEAPEGRIAGWRDAQGNYYLSEGHHRMTAAMEIFEETGDPSNVNRLLQNGLWREVERAPVGAGPLPRR